MPYITRNFAAWEKYRPVEFGITWVQAAVTARCPIATLRGASGQAGGHDPEDRRTSAPVGEGAGAWAVPKRSLDDPLGKLLPETW
jgi:hypothetical protein